MNKITLGFFRTKSKTTINGLLVLFALLLNTQVSWGQGSENFTNIPTTTPTSYLSRSWTGTNSVTWTATLARTDQTLTTKAICTNGSGSVTSPSYFNGMGTLQFNYVRGFTGSGARTIQVWVNGIKQGSDITVNANSSSSATYSSALNISGNVILELRTSGTQIIIDDISWTSYSSLTTPALTADATANTVDNNLDITFTDDSVWRGLAVVKIGTTTLTSGTDYDLTAGNLQLKPSGLNALLTASGSKSVTVVATGYTDATVTQVINAGAPTTNSTATISAALAPNTSRTITCTAKDQYNNLVSGYVFKYDAAIANNDITTAESYTLDGTAQTATATDISLVALTIASGVATFTAALPATIDGNDGISIQAQLSDGTTNIGSAFAFSQLASQTITFGSLSTVTYGDATFVLTATASSTLPVTYASSNTAVATVTGSTVTIVGAGLTNITVSQAGNGSYNAAEDVIQALTVNAIALTIPDAVAASRAYNTLLTTNITGTLTGVINSDDVTFDGTLKGTFADANVANGIAVTSACTLSGTKAGNYTLTQPTSLTANITQASQTITFGALANKIIGAADYSPGATSATSVTNAITYASSNLDVATIVSNQIQIVGIGSTNITASQAGSLNYTAATDVVRSLTVIAAPIAAWDFTGVGSVTNTSLAATTLDNGLGATSITRGASAAWSNANNSWRTTGFLNNGISTGNTDYFQITIQANTGKTVSLTTIDANFAGTASFTESPGVSSQFAYSLDGTNFTLIGSPTETIGTPATMTQIDLTAVTALQNVASGTTITLRYYASGQTTSGGWGFNSVSAGTNGLAIGGVTTLVSSTWNGTSWSNGAPTASVDAIIAGNYSAAANITAKTLTVNNSAVATIPTGNNVTVTGAVTVTAPATLTFSNNANLIQDAATTVNANSGAITVIRDSNALYRLDYTLCSSPVDSQYLLAFSPLTNATRFYTYNPSTNLYNTVVSPSTTPFAAANGYLIRMPNEDPSNLGGGSAYALGTATLTYDGAFTGLPNNGDVSVTGLTSNTYNAVGNPYPSTISADAFINGNSTDGTLYFWRKTNAGTGTAYATYNLVGTTVTAAASGNGSGVPDGTVAVGQGFIVKTGVAATTLDFTNAMRTTNNSAPFFKTRNTVERNRVWVNLTNTTGVFSQMLVAYMTDATQGVDAGIDGKYINDSAIALNSFLNNEEFVIQGRSLPFDGSDVVPLAFKTDLAGEYTIAIDHVDGLFSESQAVFLKDNSTGIETDLKAGAYAFTAAAGVDNARFSLKYQKTLGINASVFNDNSVAVYKNKGTMHIKSSGSTIDNVKIYDISGRLIFEKSKVNANDTTIESSKLGNQVLIFEITSENQIKVSKKLVN
jgi:hypothetical protein